jgi:hypothetical protein
MGGREQQKRPTQGKGGRSESQTGGKKGFFNKKGGDNNKKRLHSPKSKGGKDGDKKDFKKREFKANSKRIEKD